MNSFRKSIKFLVYVKMCWNQFNAYFDIPIQLFKLAVMVGTYLAVTHTHNVGLIVVTGAIGVVAGILAGHVIIRIGVMKYEAKISTEQNPQIEEILKIVKEIRGR